MLNEEKVILMTKMAAYASGEGKENLKIDRNFRGDYIAVEVMKAVACGTISFLLVLGVFIYYNFDNYMAQIYELDLVTLGKSILGVYIWLIVVYVLFCYLIATIRYAVARRKLKRYYNKLKKLNGMYRE